MDSETNPRSFDDIVSFNLRRARDLRGWTQQEAAEAVSEYLGRPWSVQVYGDAERAYKTDRKVKRVKVFSADELVALCRAFSLPLAWWLLPSNLADVAKVRGAREPGLTGEDLLVYLLPVEAELLEPLQRRIDDLLRGEANGVTHLDRIRSSGKVADGIIKVVKLQIEDWRQEHDKRFQQLIQSSMDQYIQQEVDRKMRDAAGRDDGTAEEG